MFAGEWKKGREWMHRGWNVLDVLNLKQKPTSPTPHAARKEEGDGKSEILGGEINKRHDRVSAKQRHINPRVLVCLSIFLITIKHHSLTHSSLSLSLETYKVAIR
jgi:hypothetical protein